MKKILPFLLVICLLSFVLGACTDTTSPSPSTSNPPVSTPTPPPTQTTTTPPPTQELVTITIPTYRSGEDVGAKLFLPQVERFNQQYAGKYQILIEESPSSTHNDKIKGLAQNKKLPPVFQFSDFTYAEQNWFNDATLYNLGSWLDANPDVKNVFVPDGLDYVARKGGGATYALPLAVLRPTGLYVNGNNFTPSKAIRDMTWEQLGSELKAAGTTYGFMTLEGAWTLNLTTVAIMAGQEGGVEILQGGLEEKIKDFNTPQWVNTFATMKKLYDDAGWKDGIGKAYPPAQNAFMNNQVGILPDGQWITDVFKVGNERQADWGAGFDGTKVVGDIFPGNVAIANPCVYDWYVSAYCTDAERECALAFLAFISSPAELEEFMLAEGGSAPMITYSASFKTKIAEDKLKSDFANIVNPNTKYIPYFHEIVPGSITDSASGAFTANLPLLLDGTQTPEQFCQALTDAANE